MKITSFFTTLLLLCLFFSGYAQTSYSSAGDYVFIPPYESEVVKERLANMECLVKPKFTSTVASYVKTYTQLRRQHSENLLGRSVMYFPMYEQKFREHGVPESLKYLSIVESGLIPKAISRSGAMGLWQFMPATGESYGLQITPYRDERCDPEMATEAAIAYLKRQYTRFGSWELALASYNSGPGRVNRAVRRARSKNFWKIQRYLPKETRAYVPAFIAATYLCKYYEAHNLTPQYPSLDMQLTKTSKVYNHISFQKIQELTGLSRYVIEDLNPAFNVDFIPASSQGYNLTLPKRVMQTVLDYLQHSVKLDSKNRDLNLATTAITIKPKPIKLNTRDEYYKSVYYVNQEDNLERIAAMFGVSKNNIMAWNNMSNTYITAGQELTLFHPNKIERWRPNMIDPIPMIRSLQPQLFEIKEAAPNLKEKLPKKVRRKKATAKKEVKVKSPKWKEKDFDLTSIRGKFIFYRVQEGENWSNIADKFPGVRLEDVLRLNRVKQDKMPKVGSKIKIKKL